jgi:DNA-directed RNA polymerase I subunit RPA2
MIRKLYSIVSGSCCPDNPDSPQHQEVLLPGILYGMIVKERMEEILHNIKNNIATDIRNGVAVDFNDSWYFLSTQVCRKKLIHPRTVLLKGVVEGEL